MTFEKRGELAWMNELNELSTQGKSYLGSSAVVWLYVTLTSKVVASVWTHVRQELQLPAIYGCRSCRDAAKRLYWKAKQFLWCSFWSSNTFWAHYIHLPTFCWDCVTAASPSMHGMDKSSCGGDTSVPSQWLKRCWSLSSLHESDLRSHSYHGYRKCGAWPSRKDRIGLFDKRRGKITRSKVSSHFFTSSLRREAKSKPRSVEVLASYHLQPKHLNRNTLKTVLHKNLCLKF